jgi:segregation and condensation protein A
LGFGFDRDRRCENALGCVGEASLRRTLALTGGRESRKLPRLHASSRHVYAVRNVQRLVRCGAVQVWAHSHDHDLGRIATVMNVDEPTIPQAAAFHIQLPTFEGPLDLLLHLIRKHELNILDLPMAFVTERYLDYLGMMEELDLDVASEYLLMAATLTHIKSKMLLPQAPTADAFEDQEEGYVEDPRAELIRRLLEYQKYKAAAASLGGRPMSGRDVFARGMSAPEAQGPAPLASIDMYKLLDAFGAILKRVKGRVALEVTAERITIHERITEISELLRTRRSCTFEELFDGVLTRYEVVVTFLALLEMTKLSMTRIYQAGPSAALHIQYALLDAEGFDAADGGGVDPDASFAYAPPDGDADRPESSEDEPGAEAAAAEGEAGGEAVDSDTALEDALALARANELNAEAADSEPAHDIDFRDQPATTIDQADAVTAHDNEEDKP